MASGSVTPDIVLKAQYDSSRLMLTQLKAVARGDGLPVSGAKAVLQDRIKNRLYEYQRNNDIQGFNNIRNLITNPDNAPTTSYGSYPSTPMQPPYTTGTSAGRGSGPFPSSISSIHSHVRLNFKDSPFYTILEHLTPVEESKVLESTKDHIDFKIKLRPDVTEKFSPNNPAREDTRIMIFCATEPLSHFTKVDITFPNQIEIKVNGAEVRANLRGLKNRPGSTRPADITDLIRKTSNYENSMTVHYALTNKKYYIVVNLVKQQPCESLVTKLQEGRAISKDQVIREMHEKAQDGEVQTTSTIMSLKCPLSTLRMNVPCRSISCSHNQCFDALSFLQLQQQAPTWTCPVCSKAVSYDALLVDHYVDDILSLTSTEVEQVEIEPDGKWSTVAPSDKSSRPNGTHSSSDDEDLIEIHDSSRIITLKDEAMATPSSIMRTPPLSSREASINSNTARSSGSKRPYSAVIDLTLSSDDDEQPSRDPKRLSLMASSNGLPRSLDTLGNAVSNSLPRSDATNFHMFRSSSSRPQGMDRGLGR